MQSQKYTVKNKKSFDFVSSILFYDVSKTRMAGLCATLKLEAAKNKKKKRKRVFSTRGLILVPDMKSTVKLETMRLRITANSSGGRGGGGDGGGGSSFYIFSKVCYLHKDYIKLSEEIVPKPTAHSLQSFFPFCQSQKSAQVQADMRAESFFKKKKEKKEFA